MFSLLFADCPLENDPLEGSGGLDGRLYGLWRFEYGRIVEEIHITREPLHPGTNGWKQPAWPPNGKPGAKLVVKPGEKERLERGHRLAETGAHRGGS
jgi:hypothetical protein